mmetsp:Transcript_39940/g.66451  ORF Transcript_39940/g.66451 Transcript_39940/m.66451 type:complete len:295 (+) Transcript_39940:1359-2243(+)
MGHWSAGSSLSAASHAARAFSIVSNRSSRAMAADAFSEPAFSIASNFSWIILTASLRADRDKPFVFATGMIDCLIISIMHLASISTVMMYWLNITVARAAVSSGVMISNDLNSSIFLGSSRRAMASTPLSNLNNPRFTASFGHSSEYPLPLKITLQCFLSASWATLIGAVPFSISSEKALKLSATKAQSTVLTMETFCVEPTARNSKRLPPYGKGDVRLRSSAGTVKSAIASTPQPMVFTLGLYSLATPVFMNSSKYEVMSSPKKVEMMAGGASQAPSRKSLPGEAMAMRIISP